MVGPILLLIALIFLNATFASAEIAVISLNDAKLKKMAADGDKRAKRLDSLTAQPARFLATIQVAITLAGLLSSAFAAENFAGPLVLALIDAGVSIPAQVLKTAAVFLITLILAYFNLVFGELVPKRIAMKKSEELALGLSGILCAVARASAPLVFLLTVSTNCILRLIGIDPEEEEETVSEEEIRMLLATGNEQGTINADESEMIKNIFDFDDITAGQIGTRRRDVVSLDKSDSVEAWESVIHRTRHTLYPVCGQDRDDIIGVLDTKDYFRLKDKSKESVMKNAVDRAHFIPESMRANTLFQSMKQSRFYFAVMIDEYGGLSGIITLHDLMEALVGDIDEVWEQKRETKIQKLSREEWRICGSADLSDVAEQLGVRLPVDKYDTFSGFLCGSVGRVPSDGERFECEAGGLRVKVLSVSNHTIGSATVRLAPEEYREPA